MEHLIELLAHRLRTGPGETLTRAVLVRNLLMVLGMLALAVVVVGACFDFTA